MNVTQARLKFGTDSFSMIDFVRNFRSHDAMKSNVMRTLDYDIDDDT